MNTLKATQILKQELTCPLINTYSITQFCKAFGVTRSVFYSKYSCLTDLFSDAIRYDIRKHFIDYRDYDISPIIFAFLKHIDQDRLFYANIYHLTIKNNGSHHICQEIRDAFFIEMRNQLFNSDYSNIYIKGVTSVLYSHVAAWLTHCDDKNAVDIYNEVRFMLPN